MGKRRKKSRKKQMFLGILAGAVCIFLITVIAREMRVIRAEEAAERLKRQEQQESKDEQEKEITGSVEQEETDEEGLLKPETIDNTLVQLTVSAIGDCTLGTDVNFDSSTSFVTKYETVNDPGYFFQGVKSVLEADDLTIANMEGTLTTETMRADKQFAFKGDPSYAKILTEGSVEAANLANNHSKDYGEKSYQDTIQALEQEKIVTFGYERTAVVDIKGIKVGLLGTYELAQGIGSKEGMEENIKKLQNEGAQLIIASFHWGNEKHTSPDEVQVQLAHAAIDAGADLVLGHHPHVLQGIEEYKGKNIVYSLGNFCFGGNKNPSDKDTMIFQQTFTFENGTLKDDNVHEIIPCTISSSDQRNDYQPTIAQGSRKEQILKRIESYSSTL